MAKDGINHTSPYFLHTSDNPGQAFVIPPFNGEDFPSWRRSILNASCAKNKVRFIDGSIKKSDVSMPWLPYGHNVIPW